MKKALLLIVPCLSLALGCRANVMAVRQRGVEFSERPKLHLSMKTATRSYDVDPATMRASDDGSEEYATGAELEAIMALEDVAFELKEIGFQLVERPQDADLVGYFSLRSLRRDLTSWVADQAHLEFRDPDTAAIVAIYRARSGLIVPSVRHMVKRLAESIQRDW